MEKIKTKISVKTFVLENPAFYEVMWENTVESDR
jgi:hypothetical protein